jgi:hypothetical protein
MSLPALGAGCDQHRARTSVKGFEKWPPSLTSAGHWKKQSLAMTDPDLVRFVNAQASVYEEVVEELTEGHKHTHWKYLSDPILGSRRRQDVRLIAGHKDRSAFEILGSPDDLGL